MKNEERIFLITPKIWIKAFDEEDARKTFFDKLILPNILSGLVTDHETGKMEDWGKDNSQEINKVVKEAANKFIEDMKS